MGYRNPRFQKQGQKNISRIREMIGGLADGGFTDL
jgi:hypothetical protein